MEIFLPEHQWFLRKLVDADVDFILVGGYAVIYHGYGRSTGDLDVWVRPEAENWTKVLMALQDIGMDEPALSHYRAADQMSRRSSLSTSRRIKWIFSPKFLWLHILTRKRRL